MQNQIMLKVKTPSILVGLALIIGLYLTSLYSYLIFHLSTEFFASVITIGVFMVVWNSRRFLDNNYFIVIGIAFLFVTGLDVLHVLSHESLGLFQGFGTNLSDNAWLAGRYLQSLSFLIAPFFINRKLKINFVFSVYFVIFLILLMPVFQVGFSEGNYVNRQLTSWVNLNQYIISIILLGSIFTIRLNSRAFDSAVLKILVAALITSLLANITSQFTISDYDALNLTSHFLNIISYYLIYKAVIEIGLAKPYNLMFKNLKQSEGELQQARDKLELRVKERTAALSKAREDLEHYSRRITQVQEEERKRIARELHDDTAQSMAIVSLEIDSLLSNGEISSEKTLDRLKHLKINIDRSMQDIRRYSHELHPSLLDHLGLVAALDQLVAEINERGNIQVNLEIKGEERKLPNDVELALFRISQESLNNIWKHAQAKKARVRMDYLLEKVKLSVVDNGKGFDIQEESEDAIKRGSLGLLSLKERAHLIGAAIKIESKLGVGSRISIEAKA